MHGIISAISHALGIGIYAFLVAVGLAVVITETPWLFKLMTYGGAAFLAWTGYKAFTSSSSVITGNNKPTSNISIRQAALDGFLISILNPKIVVFFLALFSQFVTPESTLTTQFLMALLATLCDGIWYCIVAAIAGHGRVLPVLRRKAQLINRISGTVLIIVAFRILTL